ncbi:MAG TPA: hypothetical protein VFK05_00405 [Polyangiaceae bacterium]|nr:hypothetical protein [Polyangiaceae bacterium]
MRPRVVFTTLSEVLAGTKRLEIGAPKQRRRLPALLAYSLQHGASQLRLFGPCLEKAA